jgi:hypothetical protein
MALESVITGFLSDVIFVITKREIVIIAVERRVKK